MPLNMLFATDRISCSLFWSLTITSPLLASRAIGQCILYYARLRGRNLRNLVIVGESDETYALVETHRKGA